MNQSDVTVVTGSGGAGCGRAIARLFATIGGALQYWESLTTSERQARGIPASLLSTQDVARTVLRLARTHRSLVESWRSGPGSLRDYSPGAIGVMRSWPTSLTQHVSFEFRGKCVQTA